MFSVIPLMVLFFRRVMGREGQTEAERADDFDKAIDSHGAAKEEPEEIKTRNDADQNEQIKEDDSEEETTRQAKLRVLLELASFEILIGFSALIKIEFLRKDPHQSLRLAIFCFLAFLTLLTGFCLLFQTLFMLVTRTALITQIHQRTSNILLFISTTSLIITSLSPVTLLPKPYYILPSILIPVLVTLGFYFYTRTQTNNEKETDETRANYNEQLKVITRLSELNQGLASLSSSGLIGILFGSWTNALKDAHHPYLKTAVFCMFFSFMSSLLLMLLCQMRVDSLSSKTRVNLITTIRASSAFLFIMIALAALTVSTHFLKEYIAAVLLPALLAGFVGVSMNFCTSDRGKRGAFYYPEEKLKLFFTNAAKVTTLSFGMIMDILGAYLGSKEIHMNLKIFIFFMASSFMSGITLMLLSYEAPKKLARMGVIFRILGCYLISFLAFGGLSIFLIMLLQLEII